MQHTIQKLIETHVAKFLHIYCHTYFENYVLSGRPFEGLISRKDFNESALLGQTSKGLP